MKIFRIIAVAFAAAFIGTTASAQSKSILLKENTELKTVIDSLKAEMEKVRAELRYTDSIANEMLSLYTDSESKNTVPVITEYEPSLSLYLVLSITSPDSTENLSEYVISNLVGDTTA